MDLSEGLPIKNNGILHFKTQILGKMASLIPLEDRNHHSWVTMKESLHQYQHANQGNHPVKRCA